MISLKYRRTGDLRREFFRASDRRACRWCPFIYWGGLGVYLGFALPLVSRCHACGFNNSSFSGPAVVAIFIALWFWGFYLCPWISRQIIRPVLAKPDGVVLGDGELRLTHEGVEDVGTHFKTVYDWKAVDGVTFEKNIVVIWMEPTVGVWVPRTAFNSLADEQAFKAYVEEKAVGNVRHA